MFSAFKYKEKKATSIYWFKKLQWTILLPLNPKKKTILKISSQVLSLCSGRESQSKGIELRSQLTKPYNCGGKIPKLNCIFIIIFTITICNLNEDAGVYGSGSSIPKYQFSPKHYTHLKGTNRCHSCKQSVSLNKNYPFTTWHCDLMQKHFYKIKSKFIVWSPIA